MELAVPPSFYQAVLNHHCPTYWSSCPDFTNQARAVRRHVIHFNKGSLAIPLELLFKAYPAFKNMAIVGIPLNSRTYFEPFLPPLRQEKSFSDLFPSEEKAASWSGCAKYHMEHFQDQLNKVDFNKTFTLDCCREKATLNQLASNYTCSCGYTYYYSFCLESVQCTSSCWHCSSCNKCTQNPIQCFSCNGSSDISECVMQ